MNDNTSLSDLSEDAVFGNGSGIAVEANGNEYYVKPKSIAYVPGVELNELREKFNAFLADIAPLEARKTEIANAIELLKAEYSSRLAHLNEQLYLAREDLKGSAMTKSRYEREINSAIRKFLQALQNEAAEADFLKTSEEFDKRTINAPWREWAFEHQILGGKHLASKRRAILGDSMGLGKTLTSLIACDMLLAKKILVIVPDDVVSNFVKEAQHWAPHRNIVQLGKQTKEMRQTTIMVCKMMDEFLMIGNYSMWRRDRQLLQDLVDCRFDTVICDEAHTIKETSTAAYKGVRHIVMANNTCPVCGGFIQNVYSENNTASNFDACIGNIPGTITTADAVSLDTVPVGKSCGWTSLVDVTATVRRPNIDKRSVKNFFPVTGTVILNKPTDIYSLLSLVDPENFWSQRNFERDYCYQDWDKKWKFRSGGLESLTTKLSGRYIARNRQSAGIVLPKQTEIIHTIEMDETKYPAQAKVMRDLTKHATIALSEDKNFPILAMIALITRKRQANVWPAGIEFKDPATGIILMSVGDEVQESIKLDRIIVEDPKGSDNYEGLIPDLTGSGDMINGERVVVFSQFKGPLIELERRCKTAGISVCRFDGDTPDDVKNQIKIDFDRKFCDVEGYEKKWQVVLANYKTGGVGLNFTSATQMIILDEEWNKGKADQAYARIDRVGQTEETTVHVLRIERSIDDWIAGLIQMKAEMAEGLDNAINAADFLKGLQNGEMW